MKNYGNDVLYLFATLECYMMRFQSDHIKRLTILTFTNKQYIKSRLIGVLSLKYRLLFFTLYGEVLSVLSIHHGKYKFV